MNIEYDYLKFLFIQNSVLRDNQMHSWNNDIINQVYFREIVDYHSFINVAHILIFVFVCTFIELYILNKEHNLIY